MITLFKKLQTDNLLKNDGFLLDLGSGNGLMSKAFCEIGYKATLLDKNSESLELARKELGEEKIKTVVGNIEDFKFDDKYDGVIISNVLPFVSNKAKVEEIVKNAFKSLNENGFLFFTLFGNKDEWNSKERASMSFYEKDEALKILDNPPYFQSEDFGTGTTMKGDMKTWHVFYFLYLK